MSDSDRRILRLQGADVRDFLQGLVTNDIAGLEDGLVYAALLTPQGKYIADFFLAPDGDDVLLDVSDTQGDMLSQRLSLYKLRADVEIAPSGLHMHRGLGPAPEDGFADPRNPEMGWRAYRAAPATPDDVDWDALRVACMIPSSEAELNADSFILEMGFERLAGVDFRKGCYVGQEVTARMKHKTELRKGLARVRIDGTAEPGTEITAGGKSVGRLHTVSGDTGLAYLRFDRAEAGMSAGQADISLEARG